MRDRTSRKGVELLQGTLDLLVLQTLVLGPSHGHAIATQIQRSSDDVLQVEHGSLYPALHRLERKGWIASTWRTTKELARPLKVYSLTPAGRKQLRVESSRWDALVAAMARVMKTA